MYKASYVIITVPLGILKKEMIEFWPSLPDSKKIAINNLGFGLMNKIFIEFQEQFWE